MTKNKTFIKMISVVLIITTLLSMSSMFASAANPVQVFYQAHCQDYGWMSTVKNGAVAGTTGKSKRMEAFNISIFGENGGVSYCAHVSDIGWMGAVSNGRTAGTTGKSKRIEAVKIWLTGTVASKYDIQYRVHMKDIGWGPWVQNGAVAGTTGQSRRVEAIQINLVKKTSSPAPSGTSKYTNTLNQMINGSAYGGAYRTGKKYTGDFASEQCKGFAKSVHMKLFGYNIGSTQAKPNNHLISYNSSRTKHVGSVSTSVTNCRNLFIQARPGDFVQMRRHHGGSHSAIIYSVTGDNVTFFESNLDGNNGIVTRTYTWAKLCESNSAMSLYTARNY